MIFDEVHLPLRDLFGIVADHHPPSLVIAPAGAYILVHALRRSIFWQRLEVPYALLPATFSGTGKRFSGPVGVCKGAAIPV